MAEKNVESMKAQAESVSAEYDRLAEEHSKLEKKLAIQGGDKKDDWITDLFLSSDVLFHSNYSSLPDLPAC